MRIFRSATEEMEARERAKRGKSTTEDNIYGCGTLLLAIVLLIAFLCLIIDTIFGTNLIK